MESKKEGNGWGSTYKTSAFTFIPKEKETVEPMPSITKQIIDKVKKTLLG